MSGCVCWNKGSVYVKFLRFFVFKWHVCNVKNRMNLVYNLSLVVLLLEFWCY